MTDSQRAIAGLLAAIIAEPQRDDLRLIAADAYDDDDQFERAAFIRTQVELAALAPWYHIEFNRSDEFRVQPQVKEITGTYNPAQRQYRRTMEGYASTSTWPVGPKDGDSFSLSTKIDDSNSMSADTLRLLNHDTSSVDGFTTFTFDDQGRHDPHREKRQKLKQQERELFVSAGPSQLAWFGAVHAAVPAGVDVASLLPWFSRGFISKITCTSEDFLAHADAITAQQPIEEVSLTTRPNLEHQIVHVLGHQKRLRGRSNWHSSDALRGTAPVDGTPLIVRELLFAEWPKIQFALPPYFGTDSTSLDSLSVFPVIDPNTIPAPILAEMQRAGINIPCDMHRLGDGYYAFVNCRCSAHTVRATFSAEAPIERTSPYQTITLNHISYHEANSNIVDYYYGQCPRCRTLYWRSTTYGISPVFRSNYAQMHERGGRLRRP